MYKGRFHHYECDQCGKTVFSATLPQGWSYSQSKSGKLMHFCRQQCVQDAGVDAKAIESGSLSAEYVTGDVVNA